MQVIVKTAASVVAAFLLSTTVAHATLVSSWNYSWLTQFSGDNTFKPGYQTQTETATQVSWGAPGGNVFVAGSGRSGITLSDLDTPPGGNDPVADPVTGQVVTNGTTPGEVGVGSYLTHHNNAVIASYATLLTSEIESTLTLVPNTPPLGGQVGPTTLAFTIHFAETPNSTPCAAPSPAGNPCNDIFALDANEAFNQSFVFEGLTYYASIFPLIGDDSGSFPLLTSGECAAAGANPGCVGFTTIEGQDTTIRFAFTISAQPIAAADVPLPEPGSLALVALALATAAGFARRQKAPRRH
jgi:hypothetical protein